jgi:hypothetical protein
MICVRNGALGTIPGQDKVFRQLNDNLHYTALYNLKALINIVICVMLLLSLLATLQYTTSPSIDAIKISPSHKRIQRLLVSSKIQMYNLQLATSFPAYGYEYEYVKQYL